MKKLLKPHASFSFEIQSYDPYKKEYTLQNKLTGEIKTLSRKEFEILFKEQYGEAIYLQKK